MLPLKGSLLAAGVAVGALLAAPGANASVDCEHRSAAHVAEHGGLKADSEWHIAHGPRPTCSDGHDEPTPATTTPAPKPVPAAGDDDDDHHERKSRHCCKHWYC